MFIDNIKEERKGWSRLKILKRKIKTLVLKLQLSTKQLSKSWRYLITGAADRNN